MKIGDYEKFNECCGMACVANEATNENWVVVYADVFDKSLFADGELGRVVGKGKTKEEALIDAVKFLICREKVYEDALSENNVNNVLLEAIQFLSSRMLTNQKEVVLPIKAWEYNCEGDISKTGEHWNASIFIDSEGKAVEGRA